MLPNYLVIGAAKCGTSTLCHNLGQHPDVFMSQPKEIHYFGRNDPQKTRLWYEAHFEAARNRRAVGEGSTSYTHPDIIDACVAEIAELIPDCRLIYIVRDPIARLESDWKMRRHEGWSAESINLAVEQQASLITHGLYWQNLGAYRKRFADEQILVVFLEDLSRDPASEMRRCLLHLGVDPDLEIDGAGEARNAASGYRTYSGLARWLRGGVWRAVRPFAPRWAVEAAKAALTRRVRIEVDWDPAVRHRVAAQFQDDARRLLEFCGKPPDFWPSTSPATTTSG